MRNSINWFEIPVSDFARAKNFYGALFATEIQEMPHSMFKYGILPGDMQNGVTGGIVQGEGFTPSSTGVLIYLNGGDDLATPLSRVEAAGGKIVMPKTSIGPNGFMAHFLDTEGNKIALHSMK
ncbi:MAG: VOC family protein [Saprospiraceae bacterium]|nr:VOC family protein [Saprospiraceae bacterium]